MGRLELIEVTKRLGKTIAVQSVSFTVEDGEFFVLLGPSGCGKSTLLRLIAGLEALDAGQIVLDGRDISTIPSRDRNLGMVFQDYGLYPNMNVFQNIAYGLQARGVKKEVVDQLVPRAAGRLGLGDMLRKSINELSGGEQQRVALARAMAKDADAYLYDEPLSNLDPKLRHKARRDIVTVHQDKRKPSLYVTHDQSEAFSMGDRIAIMSQGMIQQVGTPDELILSPRNTFVAGFVGSPPMNLIEGEIVPGSANGSGPGYLFRREQWSLPLTDAWTPIFKRLGPVHAILGVRPSSLSLVPPSAPVEGPIHRATLSTLEGLLGETLVDLAITDILRFTAVVPDEGVPADGSTISFTIDPSGILLFDAHGGENLFTA